MQFRFFFVISAMLLLFKPSLSLASELNDTVCCDIPVIDTVCTAASPIAADSIPKEEVKQNKRKKLVTAGFAFPFPFGFMGAHRVMLGTAPWVPVAYAATFGGCFGLLPLIDFFVITFSKDISAYENNPHIFMWVK
jgi:TM2 domain-containing membrane protein YozV